MATLKPVFTKFISLLLLLLHLGCFLFPSKDHRRHPLPKKRKPFSSSASDHRSPSPSPLKLHTHNALSSSWSFLKRIFTPKPTSHISQTHPKPATPSSSSSLISVTPPDASISGSPRNRPPGSRPESEFSADKHFFPLRNDIYPCPACGEIFQKPNLLEQHQSIKHAVSELTDGDSGNNIVRIIFKTGWPDRARNPSIFRILKIHNSPKILARFEEYRETVKARASRNCAVRRRDERCIADGNELLRFHCATYLCELGQNGNSSVCNNQYCSVCGIIRGGFSSKMMDGISTLSTSWRAHVAIPEEVEEEFKFMHVRRAMLVCRVIAGRVGSCDGDEVVVADKEDPGFDSVAGGGGGVYTRLDEEDELLVFNPRAVLPCFVIVYTV